VLAYSRFLHLRFYRDERQSTLLEGLARAFEALGGVALRLVFDYVARHIIEVLCPSALCGRRGPVHRSGAGLALTSAT
jgi:transposase